MDPDTLLSDVRSAVTTRHEIEDRLTAATAAERRAILAAFDAGVAPTAIAEAAGSSRAWVHKLDKVRRGGAAAPRRTRRRGLVSSTTTSETEH